MNINKWILSEYHYQANGKHKTCLRPSRTKQGQLYFKKNNLESKQGVENQPLYLSKLLSNLF